MAKSKKWFVIINPTSGNGSSKHKWPEIKTLLEQYQFDFQFEFTTHHNHSFELVQQAISNNFLNIISIGGDGTLHNIVNGIMSQNLVESTKINVGVIPIGTGNDWVKTHGIPNNFERAVQIIKNGNLKHQDLGKIKLLNHNSKIVHFMNLAGIGFDGYVVSKVEKHKHFGALAYLAGTLAGLFSFNNFKAKVAINSQTIEDRYLMVLIGLCNYSGGGMKLTKTPDAFDGLFDISLAKNISKLDIIKNVLTLFNGKIVEHKKVDTYKSDEVTVNITDIELPLIQADGELIGSGNISVSLIKNAFSFYA